MAVKLSIRLDDVLTELSELETAARDNGDQKRVRDITALIKAVEDAQCLATEVDRAASGMSAILDYASNR